MEKELFAKVPKLAAKTEMNHISAHLLLLLCDFRNIKTGLCNPGMGILMALLKCSKSAVSAARTELQQKGLINFWIHNNRVYYKILGIKLPKRAVDADKDYYASLAE